MPEDVGCPCGHQGSILNETNREGGRVGWNHSPIVRACLISAQHHRMVNINCLCMPSPCSALWAGSLVASFLHTFSASCSLLSGIVKLVSPSQSIALVADSRIVILHCALQLTIPNVIQCRCRGKSVVQEVQPTIVVQ